MPPPEAVCRGGRARAGPGRLRGITGAWGRGEGRWGAEAPDDGGVRAHVGGRRGADPGPGGAGRGMEGPEVAGHGESAGGPDATGGVAGRPAGRDGYQVRVRGVLVCLPRLVHARAHCGARGCGGWRPRRGPDGPQSDSEWARRGGRAGQRRDAQRRAQPGAALPTPAYCYPDPHTYTATGPHPHT